jgi:hypothetical protein
MYTAGTNTTSKDKCVVQRWRYIIFTEARSPLAKRHYINGEKCRNSGRVRERETLSKRTEKQDVYVEIISTERLYLLDRDLGYPWTEIQI